MQGKLKLGRLYKSVITHVRKGAILKKLQVRQEGPVGHNGCRTLFGYHIPIFSSIDVDGKVLASTVLEVRNSRPKL